MYKFAYDKKNHYLLGLSVQKTIKMTLNRNTTKWITLK